MLVLSRQKNQTIVIDENITIEVLQIKGKNVRLGIKAPNEVRVLRGELKPFDQLSVAKNACLNSATERIGMQIPA